MQPEKRALESDEKIPLVKTFSATIEIIGINPYVLLPPRLLQQLLKQAGKDKGPVPVRLRIHEKEFTQTLVKFAGEWRLYLNMPMRKAAGKDVGEEIEISLALDSEERTTPMHPALQKALGENKKAAEKLESLSPSRRKEILRYINHLKSEEAINRNVKRAIQFLLGEERFIGRDRP